MYYIEGICMTAGGKKADTILSEYEGKYRFVQYFERAWTNIEFKCPITALNILRKMYPDKTLYLNDMEKEIYGVREDYCFPLYKLTKIK